MRMEKRHPKKVSQKQDRRFQDSEVQRHPEQWLHTETRQRGSGRRGEKRRTSSSKGKRNLALLELTSTTMTRTN